MPLRWLAGVGQHLHVPLCSAHRTGYQNEAAFRVPLRWVLAIMTLCIAWWESAAAADPAAHSLWRGAGKPYSSRGKKKYRFAKFSASPNITCFCCSGAHFDLSNKENQRPASGEEPDYDNLHSDDSDEEIHYREEDSKSLARKMRVDIVVLNVGTSGKDSLHLREALSPALIVWVIRA